ncbi:MAG: nucleotide exchange factor GrpE [Candidatus Nealsonbacteria bacterium]|nr:MAG: nucleotide exchange factor GrpE [Candidatus Nealsonbacteria bacterium]
MEKKDKKPSSAKALEGKEEKRLVEEIKQKLKETEKLKAEYLASWQRERADFLNYKKGDLERIGEIIKYADTGLIFKFLPVLDNLELAERKLPKDLKDNKNIKGLLQIKTQIKDILKSQGVEEIESLGKKFNPNFHEVVEEVEQSDVESGIVVEEIQKGYKIHGKILRPAKVKVKVSK